MFHGVNRLAEDNIPIHFDISDQLRAIDSYFERDLAEKMPQDVYFSHVELRRDHIHSMMN